MAAEVSSINCLPNEIITIILENIDGRDILSFGATCRRFNEFVKSNQYLWKDITKRTLPEHLYKVLEENCDGDWLDELKCFFTVKKQIYINLCAMSPEFYGQDDDLSIQDVMPFFKVALCNKFTYNYSIYILQEVVSKGNEIVDEAKNVEKPFTLTEMHYAVIVLRHLIHTFLSLKWVRAHMGKALPPDTVCNFFIQWIDNITMHPDEDVDVRIEELVTHVKLILQAETGKTGDEEGEKKIPDPEVLAAVTQVIYWERNMAVTTAATLETLDIVQVLDNSVGCDISVAVIYQAVARKCGVNCELIVFPNHLFLEWRDNSEPKNPQIYTIDLLCGELHIRRNCPFSHNSLAPNFRYYPDYLLQYMSTAYHMSAGGVRNCNTYNALHLLDFLGTNINTPISYRNSLPYLLNHTHLSAINGPLHLEHLSIAHMEIIRTLSSLGAPSECVKKRFSTKKHGSNVKYGVGMTCYHIKYDYVCIIRSWEEQCALKWQCQMTAENLYFGVTQPFYNVIASDQSERYVPQEYLNDFAHPTRMYHVEDVIAPEFTHFDGFAYIPNDEKRREYPEDEAIVNVYRERYLLLS